MTTHTTPVPGPPALDESVAYHANELAVTIGRVFHAVEEDRLDPAEFRGLLAAAPTIRTAYEMLGELLANIDPRDDDEDDA